MTAVATDRLGWGPLRSVTLALGRGRHSLIGSPAETSAAVALLAGAQRPRRGTVRVDQRDPRRDPGVRRRIGSLLESEPPPPGRSVRAGLTLTLGDRRAVEPTLASLGLSAWADRKTDGLSLAERRSIALTTALATPDPVLVVLWEPFAHTSGVSRAALLGRLVEIGEHCCLVCATSSVRDALSVGGTACVVNAGEVVANALALASEIAPANVSDYVVRTERPRELVAALTRRPEIVGVDWDGRVAPRLLHVRGRDGEAAARAIVATARGADIPIESMMAEDPSLKLVQSASLGAMRAAQDQAYRTAIPAPLPATTPRPASPPGSEALSPLPSSLPGTTPSGVPLGGLTGTSVHLDGSTATAGSPFDATPAAPPAPSPPLAPPAPSLGPDKPDEGGSR
jgi:ABC-type multidrug transport system ATPase subunit